MRPRAMKLMISGVMRSSGDGESFVFAVFIVDDDDIFLAKS
jgi:hypothetical protein